jgi:hypothetical protein
MINYVKFKGADGALYINPDIIQMFGIGEERKCMIALGQIDSRNMKLAGYVVNETPTEIERKLKKYYERKSRIFRGPEVDYTTWSSTSTDTPERLEEIRPVPIEKIMYPTSTEQNMTVAQTETMYTTDPNTPLPPGGKWVQTGCYLYGPYWVSPGHYQADRRSELWMAEIPLSQGPSL